MTLFTRDQFAKPDDDVGVFIDGLGRALVTWLAMQDRGPITVVDAANVFNTTPEVVMEAVQGALWIYEDDGVLNLDGE